MMAREYCIVKEEMIAINKEEMIAINNVYRKL